MQIILNLLSDLTLCMFYDVIAFVETFLCYRGTVFEIFYQLFFLSHVYVVSP